MRKLSEMKIAKEAMLSEVETAEKGGRVVTGANTNYYGPSNPTSLYTYVDGFPWGPDELSGSLFGDSWRTYAVKEEPSFQIAKLDVSERKAS